MEKEKKTGRKMSKNNLEESEANCTNQCNQMAKCECECGGERAGESEWAEVAMTTMKMPDSGWKGGGEREGKQKANADADAGN